jgi:hypothetical protein
MDAVSMTTHAKYDTALTMEERFKRHSQPLKGITIIPYMFMNSPTPPLQKKFTRAPNKTFLCMRCQCTKVTKFGDEKLAYFCAFKAEFKKALAIESGAQGGLVDIRTEGQKSCDTVPFNKLFMYFF